LNFNFTVEFVNTFSTLIPISLSGLNAISAVVFLGMNGTTKDG